MYELVIFLTLKDVRRRYRSSPELSLALSYPRSWGIAGRRNGYIDFLPLLEVFGIGAQFASSLLFAIAHGSKETRYYCHSPLSTRFLLYKKPATSWTILYILSIAFFSLQTPYSTIKFDFRMSQKSENDRGSTTAVAATTRK